MRRLNLSTTLTVAGDVTTGTISYSGLSSPTVTEIGDNPDVSVASDGVCTFAALGSGSEAVTVKVQDAAGYWISGPVTITGDGSEAYQYYPLGMNLATPATYSGAYPFANMCHSMGLWSHRNTGGGSGAFTQDFGTISAAVDTDVFRAYLSDNGKGWPSGTYTVNNPDGCEIAFGYNNDAPGTFTTSTSFTQSLSPSGGNGVYLFVKGCLTKPLTRLEIIQPGHAVSYAAGNIFADYFLDFIADFSPLRIMDWISASDSIETDWSQRAPTNKISFRSGCAYGKSIVPWEYIFDLANRTGADLWLNYPVRATASYLTSLAALAASALDPGINITPERGNETWNPGDYWKECKAWQDYFANTKITATANYGANTFTLVGHGLITGDDVRCFTTPENEINALNQNYPNPTVAGGLADSNLAYVERVDADTFKLYSDVGRTTQLTVSSKQLSQIVMNNIYASASTTYGDMCIEMWDIFDAALGVDRVVHTIPSQSGSYLAAVTSQRFSNTTAAARADAVAVAPYFNGTFWAGRIVTSTGAFSPEVWASDSGHFFDVAVYAAGATPTVEDVLNGAGAISHIRGTSYTHANFWRRESAGLALVSGLSNGTSYEVFFVLDSTYMATETVTASASETKNYIFDSAENQGTRLILNTYYTSPTVDPYNHVTASGGKDVICYEVGPDFAGDWPYDGAPVDLNIDVWRADVLQEEPAYADAIVKAVHMRAAQGLSKLTYYADVGTTSFSVANSYEDVTDYRYAGLQALGGRVRVYEPPVVDDVTVSQITAEPGAYPTTVYTFPDASLNYKIFAGNASENFDISGNTIRIIADDNVDWASSTSYNLRIMADNGYTIGLATITVTLGATVLEDETNALLARLSSAPDATHKIQINTMLASIKAAGVLSKCDGLYVNTMPVVGQIVENWASTSYDQANSGGTFTADSGVAGNGTSAYLSTAFNPSTASSPQYARDSAHVWCYSLSTAASSGSYEVGSVGTGTTSLSTGRSDQANAPRGGINGPFVNYPVQADCEGMYILSRTSSTLCTMYKNGSSIGTDSSASSGPPASTALTALRYNTTYSDKALAAWGFGGGLSGAEAAALSSAVTTYLTARGAI